MVDESHQWKEINENKTPPCHQTLLPHGVTSCDIAHLHRCDISLLHLDIQPASLLVDVVKFIPQLRGEEFGVGVPLSVAKEGK